MFSFEVVASPLHEVDAVEQLIAPVQTELEGAGGSIGPSGPEVPHVFVVATGGTEKALLDRIAERRSSTGESPSLLVAHRDHNSLPAALETLARLHQDGQRGRIVLGGEVGDRPTLTEALHDIEVVHRFKHCRLGLIGEPSPWLVASTPSADVVARSWGPTLVAVDMADVLAVAQETPVAMGTKIAHRFSQHEPAHALPPAGDVATAAHLHPVLEHVSDHNELDAITVRCFDFLGALETSGCVALAQMNEDGFVAGCEGDVPSALALLWARYLLGQPGWIANPASLDVEADKIELAHCTIAPSMVQDVSLSSHFESGIGVGLHGRFEPGPITLIRIGGRELDEVWLAEGHIVDSLESTDRCRTQATVALESGRVRELLEHPLGNHVVMVAGHHGGRLAQWWEFAIAHSSF